jgi:hypothetical protein
MWDLAFRWHQMAMSGLVILVSKPLSAAKRTILPERQPRITASRNSRPMAVPFHLMLPDTPKVIFPGRSLPWLILLDSNIWVANCGNDSFTYYPSGSHEDGSNISDIDLAKPFGLTIGVNGTAWVVGNKSNSLAILDTNGGPLITISGTDGPIQQLTHPMSIAANSQGNIWVANSDVVDAPCNPPARDFGDAENPSIALLTTNGQFHPNSPFNGGGVLIPRGITVDGNDTVWVANFGVNPKYDNPEDIGNMGAPPRVSQFWVMDKAKCPPG